MMIDNVEQRRAWLHTGALVRKVTIILTERAYQALDEAGDKSGRARGVYGRMALVDVLAKDGLVTIPGPEGDGDAA